jgi:hypothetical protein
MVATKVSTNSTALRVKGSGKVIPVQIVEALRVVRG